MLGRRKDWWPIRRMAFLHHVAATRGKYNIHSLALSFSLSRALSLSTRSPLVISGICTGDLDEYPMNIRYNSTALRRDFSRSS